MKQADSTTLESLSSVKLGFISPKALAENKDLCGGGPGIVGTGPFVFKSYQRGQAAVFERNPDYQLGPGNAQHQGPAYLDRVTYRFLPEAAVRTASLSSRQVELLERLRPAHIAVFDNVDGFQYLTGPSATTTFSL